MLPKGWVSSPFGALLEFNPKHKPETDRDQLVSFVPMSSIDEHVGEIGQSAPRPLRDVWTGYTHFAEGDILFAKITPCMENGKAAVVSGMTNGLACGSTEFFVLRSLGATLPEYVWRFLRQSTFRSEAERHMTGVVGQRRVPREFLEASCLPLPPLAEQRRIVAKLDALTARIARARAELERTSELAKELRLSALNRNLAVAASAVPRVKFSSRLSILTSGSRDWSKYYGAGSSVFVLAGNIRQLAFDPTPRQYIDPPLSSSDARRSRISKNDLLITIVGAGTGDICYVEDNFKDYFVCQSVARAVLKDDRLALFYAYWFAAPEHGRADFEAAMYGAARPHLSFDHLKGFMVPDIDADAAQEAVRQINTAFARANRLEAEATRAKKLLDRLETAILAKAFRGELVPQDPADEPASVLLDRIRAERAAAPKAKRGRRPSVTTAP